MRKPTILLACLAAAAVLTAGQCGPKPNGSGPDRPGPRDPYVGAVNPEGRMLALVIDKSLSMDLNDPRRYNEQGPQLAVAITSSRDNVGAVTFSDEAQVVAKLQQLKDKSVRLEFQRQLSLIRRVGRTNYVDSIRSAAEMFTRAQAPAGSAVIFLTDGQHNIGGTSADVMKQAAVCAQNGWKVFVIALGDEAQTSTLARDIAVRTEAAFFPVVRAEELMQAFLKILAQVYSFVEFDGGIRPIRVLPGTNRLVYLMIKQAPETTISRLTREGADVDWSVTPTVYKYPVTADRLGDFEALNIEQPESGTWEATITGPAKVGWILQQPAFTLSLEDGAPAGTYHVGETIEIGLRAEGNAEALAVLARTGRATAELSTQDGRKIGDVALEPSGGARWRGRTAAKLAGGGEDEVQQVIVRFSYTEEGGGSWSHEKRATLLVKSGPPEAKVGLSVSTIDFGTIWADGGDVTREITVTSEGASAAKMRVRAEGGVDAGPSDFDLPAGGSRTVKVTVSPKAGEGAHEGTVTIDGVQTEDAARVRTAPVKVTWRVLQLEGKPSVDIGRVKQGQTFKVPLDYKVGDRKLKVSAGGLRGGVEDLKVVEEDGKLWLTGRVPGDAEDQRYTGEIQIGIEGEPVAPKRVPVTVDVAGAAPEVALKTPSIEITSSDEDAWSEAQVEFSFSFVRDATVKFVRSDLAGKAGKISGGLQQKVKPAGGWDGKTVKSGQSYAFTYSAYLSNDTPRETFTGKLVLQVDDGKKTHDVEIPVTVTFKE